MCFKANVVEDCLAALRIFAQRNICNSSTFVRCRSAVETDFSKGSLGFSAA